MIPKGELFVNCVVPEEKKNAFFRIQQNNKHLSSI